jgi:hypothetical protein
VGQGSPTLFQEFAGLVLESEAVPESNQIRYINYSEI